MFKFSMFARQNDRPATRRPMTSRRPLLEDLEGRNLLTTFAIVGQHIGMAASSIQGQHIGVVDSSIQGQHIGVVDSIQGQHIGVVDSIQGQHIG